MENISEDMRLSIDDVDRTELMWMDNQEYYINNIKLECKLQSEKHYRTGKQQIKLFNILSIPPIILPIIMSGLTDVFKDYPLVNTFCFITVGVLSALNSFLNLGKLAQENFEYESKFTELVNDINLELVKPKKYRIACDVFLERITLKYNQMVKDEPLTISISKKIEDFGTPRGEERKFYKN